MTEHLIENHNLLVDETVGIEKWTEEKLTEILNKYHIDINYDNSMLLCFVASTQCHDMNNYQNVNLFLRMGADPHLIMDNDLIIFDTTTEVKIYLDAIFQSFGHKCQWQALPNGKFLDLEKMLDNANIDEINDKLENDESNMEAIPESPKERYFKMMDSSGNYGGRYTGYEPEQAASKAYTKLLQELKKNNLDPPEYSTITMIESSRGSDRNIFKFKASRVKLDEPEKLVIKNKETGTEKTIFYHYKNKIEKIND